MRLHPNPPISQTTTQSHPPAFHREREKQIRSLTQTKRKLVEKSTRKKYDNKSHTVNYIQINH